MLFHSPHLGKKRTFSHRCSFFPERSLIIPPHSSILKGSTWGWEGWPFFFFFLLHPPIKSPPPSVLSSSTRYPLWLTSWLLPCVPWGLWHLTPQFSSLPFILATSWWLQYPCHNLCLSHHCMFSVCGVVSFKNLASPVIFDLNSSELHFHSTFFPGSSPPRMLYC